MVDHRGETWLQPAAEGTRETQAHVYSPGKPPLCGLECTSQNVGEMDKEKTAPGEFKTETQQGAQLTLPLGLRAPMAS